MSKTIVEEVEAGDLLGSRAENHFIQFNLLYSSALP